MVFRENCRKYYTQFGMVVYLRNQWMAYKKIPQHSVWKMLFLNCFPFFTLVFVWYLRYFKCYFNYILCFFFWLGKLPATNILTDLSFWKAPLNPSPFLYLLFLYHSLNPLNITQKSRYRPTDVSVETTKVELIISQCLREILYILNWRG